LSYDSFRFSCNYGFMNITLVKTVIGEFAETRK
jgi:hypothetical protein